MKRKSLLMLAVIIGGIIFCFSYSSKVQKNVTLKCVYMGYACGDCYPQYGVRGITPSSLGKKMLNEDIDVEFLSKKQEEEFKKTIGICGICYRYGFKGDLYYSNRKRCYVIKLHEYQLSMEDKKCCEF